MKTVFAVIAVLLCAAAAGTYISYPDVRSEVPVLYWVTDINPAREEQIAGFHRWLITTGHGEEVVLRTAADVAHFRSRRLTPPLVSAIQQITPAASAIWNQTVGPPVLPIAL